jgi:tRNA modification GTPase
MIRYSLNDTIAAVATGAGESGIGIVRISGKEALSIADKIFFSGAKCRPSEFKTYTTHYGLIKDGNEIVDEVILTVMREPASYTKEDVVEINCHGGIVALRKALELVLNNGARLAEPGEFTKRAFLNGRIDLSQAEAVLDIIRAKTDSALEAGIIQLKGALSKEIAAVRNSLVGVLSELEANIDFPEDGGSCKDGTEIRKAITTCNKRLAELIAGSLTGKILREGIHVVICGKPNVGKSSLLNRLLKEERAIVTPVAGTTRDTIEEMLDIKGIPVRITDTAGILKPRSAVEKKAVKRSRDYIARADIVMLMFDASKQLNKSDRSLIKQLKRKNTIAILNKIDLKARIEKSQICANFRRVIEVSAKKGSGIKLIENEIADFVYGGCIKPRESVIVTNRRHVEKLHLAQKLLAEAANSLDNRLSFEFISQDIKDALLLLDEITGRVFSDDLLDKIFSSFCIGK